MKRFAANFTIRLLCIMCVAAIAHAQTAGPALTFSTYLPNSSPYGYGLGPALAVDAKGQVHIASITSGANSATQVIVVRTLSADRTQYLASTTLAGSKIGGIGTDGAGNTYIAFATIDSFSVPTPQPPTAGALNAGGNYALAKLAPDGSIVYVAYTGGYDVRAIAVDSLGDVYLTGLAVSSTPVTSGAFQTAFPSGALTPGTVTTPVGYCSYVQKLDPTGSKFLYSTFFGGPVPPYSGFGTLAHAITVDGTGAAYIGGQSSSLPSEANAIQPGPAFGGFVARLLPDGSSVSFSTFLTGSGAMYLPEGGNGATDLVNGIAVDASRNIHVAGMAYSPDFPFTIEQVTPLAVSTSNPSAIFVAALDPSAQVLLYSTVVGAGSRGSFAVNTAGEAFIAAAGSGVTSATADAIEQTQQFGSDFFIAKLDPAGTIKEMWPFIASQTRISSVALGSNGSVLVSGNTDAYGNSMTSSTSSSYHDLPMVNALQDTSDFYPGFQPFVAEISQSSSPQLGVVRRTQPWFVLRNVGSTPASIDSVTGDSVTQVTNGCPTTLQPDNECTIFYSVKMNSNPGHITVASDAFSSPRTWPVPWGFEPVIETMALDANATFPVQMSGSASLPVRLRLNAVSRTPITISAVNTAPGIYQTNDCGSVIGLGQHCWITASNSLSQLPYPSTALSVTFPGGVAAAGMHSSGIVSTPLFSSATYLRFSTQAPSASGLPRSFSLTNVTNTPVTLGSFAVAGHFQQQNRCTTLAPGESCRVAVRFAPQTNEDATGTLDITYSGGTQHLDLFGTGRIASSLSLSSISLNFYSTVVGRSSAPLSVTATNKSVSPLSITSMRLSPDYAQTNTCPPELAPGQSCVISVVFSPTVVGDRSGAMYIDMSDGPSQVVNLLGTGSGPVRFTPVSLDFGNASVGNTTLDLNVALTGPRSISSITTTGDFHVVSNPCSVIPANYACSIRVVFAPTKLGPQVGSLIVATPESPVLSTMTLAGSGTTTGDQSGSKIAILAPLDRSASPSPVHVIANAASLSTASTMWVYADNQTAGVAYGNKIDVLVPLAPGAHKFAVEAWQPDYSAFASSIDIVVVNTAPQTGWWWDSKLSGTGFFIEYGGKSGNGMFVGGFLYDAGGNSTWLASTGQMSGSTFTSTWSKVTGGQTLTGPYKAPSASGAGNLGLSFTDPTHAVMTRPDGSQINLSRFSFTGSASPAPPVAGAPQSGWWWAGSSLSGTGYGIEIQGSSVFIVAYVYDDAGNPVWYLATGNLSSPTSYSGTWDLYSGGPQLTSPEGTYSATKVSGKSVAMALTFSDATHATLTMGSVTIPIVRFQEF